MRRYFVRSLIVLAVLVGLRTLAAAGNEPRPVGAPAAALAEEGSDSEKEDKKPDEPAPADAAAKTDKASPDDGQSPAKDAEKSDAAESKDKDADAAKKEEGPAKADDKAAKPEEKRKTYKVEPKRLRIDLSLDGTFAASKMEEVALRPDSWSEYEIVEVAELGAKVRKGQVLFKFDAKKIDEAIDDLELEQRLNELAIVRTEEELPRMETTLKMDFEDADRSDRETKEDFKRYNEIDRPMSVKSAEFMLKFYRSNFDYEKDELDQLEKMYKADDLTEETEEIVLKRQRNAVEFAEFSMENAKLNTDETLNIRLPRMDVRMKDSLDRAALAKARANGALPRPESRPLRIGAAEESPHQIAR